MCIWPKYGSVATCHRTLVSVQRRHYSASTNQRSVSTAHCCTLRSMLFEHKTFGNRTIMCPQVLPCPVATEQSLVAKENCTEHLSHCLAQQAHPRHVYVQSNIHENMYTHTKANSETWQTTPLSIHTIIYYSRNMREQSKNTNIYPETHTLSAWLTSALP